MTRPVRDRGLLTSPDGEPFQFFRRRPAARAVSVCARASRRSGGGAQPEGLSAAPPRTYINPSLFVSRIVRGSERSLRRRAGSRSRISTRDNFMTVSTREENRPRFYGKLYRRPRALRHEVDRGTLLDRDPLDPRTVSLAGFDQQTSPSRLLFQRRFVSWFHGSRSTASVYAALFLRGEL